VANDVKRKFLAELSRKFGTLRKLANSLSLYEVGDGLARIYIRYSKVHPRRITWYGLRQSDLAVLEGFPSFICFLWNSQIEPLIVPFDDFDEVFRSTSPAADGQYKVQVHLEDEGVELYIAQAGRFNAEGYLGWAALERAVDISKVPQQRDLSHAQVQTLLGAIGSARGYGVWIPYNDRGKLDWAVSSRFDFFDTLPHMFQQITGVIQEVDVIWLERGSGKLNALFEVEHSTPIYSGLLRFNDIHLVNPNLQTRFSIVSNFVRRDLFVRQLSRPTFRASGLNNLCSFLDYENVMAWHNRIAKQRTAYDA